MHPRNYLLLSFFLFCVVSTVYGDTFVKAGVWMDNVENEDRKMVCTITCVDENPTPTPPPHHHDHPHHHGDCNETNGDCPCDPTTPTPTGEPCPCKTTTTTTTTPAASTTTTIVPSTTTTGLNPNPTTTTTRGQNPNISTTTTTVVASTTTNPTPSTTTTPIMPITTTSQFLNSPTVTTTQPSTTTSEKPSNTTTNIPITTTTHQPTPPPTGTPKPITTTTIIIPKSTTTTVKPISSSTTTTQKPTTTTTVVTPSPPPQTCGNATKRVCLRGDPHYDTLDGAHFDYQGTCPFTFMQPCTSIQGYENFSVKVKNRHYDGYPQSISWIDSTLIELFGQKIYIDIVGTLYINGVSQNYPYYYPNQANAKITIQKNGFQITIKTKDSIQVFFDTFGNYEFCVDIPDCAPFYGSNKLCGLAGNYDGNCVNDLIKNDGSLTPKQSQPCDYGNSMNDFANSWITTDYFYPPGVTNKTCEKGVDSADNNCAAGTTTCKAMKDAISNIGIFAQCNKLGSNVLNSYFSDCVKDLCEAPTLKCDVFNSFARMCQRELKLTSLGDWRTPIGCPACPSGWQMYEPTTSCYSVIKNCMFDDCEKQCQSMGAHLTSIHSSGENVFVNKLSASGTSQIDYGQVAIGAKRSGNNIIWTDGTPLDYTNWSLGNPDNRGGQQNCVNTNADEGGYGGVLYTWDDTGCDQPFRAAVCKKPYAW